MLGSEVLDHLVRLKHVGPDLASEVDAPLLAADLGQFRVTLLAFQVQETGGQHLHGTVLVLVLAPLVLAGSHDPGRQVCNADR